MQVKWKEDELRIEVEASPKESNNKRIRKTLAYSRTIETILKSNHKFEMNYPISQRKLPLRAPSPIPNESITSRNPMKDINQKTDGCVCAVIGVYISGECDSDSTAATLPHVDVIEAGGGGDNASK